MSQGTNIITLQLTVPALERLFADDPEIIMVLRKGVIAEFARKKIGLVLDAAAQAQIAHEVTKQVGEIKGYPAKITLEKKLLEELQSQTSLTISAKRAEMLALAKEAAEAAVEQIRIDLPGLISAEVKRRVSAEIVKSVTFQVQQKMDAAVKALQV